MLARIADWRLSRLWFVIYRRKSRRPNAGLRAFLIPLLIFMLGAVTGSQTLGAPRPTQQGQDLVLPPAGEEPAPKYSWAPQLLAGIISSSNPAALNSLYDAAFAAGPSLVPQLEAALGDDRTAEFAAQSLAFIGGNQAKADLARLVHDPRDLDLRRFYYGALGEYTDPADTQILLSVIRNANHEPDRTVTDAAIVALTVRSDPSILPPLEQAESKLTDPVIRDDLAGAISIIQERAHYLASRGGQDSGSSIEQAVRLYFLP
ncbi:MAG: HEAT repeat domain-containing protein, partial [Terriglobia bacterium]